MVATTFGEPGRADAASAAPEALAGTGKPLVVAGSIGSPGNLGRPIVEEDPALPPCARAQVRPGN
ncbi:hypothetical protein ACIA5G_25335 [Amycolatopsis sp. NPDC051758]|uniref:hypothetical protein n=1 Tax=Amycolatopsis sp. NPDC051758 TaxID=3363935 RepID=UPI0037A26098